MQGILIFRAWGKGGLQTPEILLKTVGHLSRKMHQRHQILHNRFQNGLLKVWDWLSVLPPKGISIPPSLLGPRGGPELEEPSAP